MYSSVKRKTCKCGCGRMPTISMDGWSYNCAPEEIKSKYKSKRDFQIKRYNAAKSASTRLRMDKYKENTELELWFRYHMVNSKRICENCGSDLSHYNDADWKGSQHHIIDKSGINGCPSVSTNRLNHGVLGKWCCHSKWHTSYSNAIKMPFFKIAKARFELFKDQIKDSEKSKIPDVFL